MRKVSRAENWERAYEAFQQINFSAWDYTTIKESILDYLKLYYPEEFNDYIETSELVTIIESFAYLGELIAYRLDMNAHENFISTAQRKESVLRLAKLISYNPSRNIPARGLVKLNSISTTERIFDSNGIDLSNKVINWNDPVNSNWKEQFVLVMNRVLEQEFGSVLPSDRVQVQDVLFELYALNNNPLQNNTIGYSVSVSAESYPMELVSSELDEFGPHEKRPEKNLKLNILYLNDGLGDSSENTGFFFFTKQGTMYSSTADFDGVTPNQTLDISIPNCNETDIWVNNIDPDTGLIVVGTDVTAATRFGEWERVDIANAQNVIFNTNPQRNKFEVETLDRDQFRLIFGDGKFANIPSGRFEIWYRVSANIDLIIPTNSIQNVGGNFNYYDAESHEQTFSFTFSLVDPIQNSAPSEDIERIRKIAPAVYYTQDRMVNGRDYNEFMLQDNTILKLRAINRTFAGDSKYIYWHDPREYYENVKIFGNDLVVYFKTAAKNLTILGTDIPQEDGGANADLIDALVDNYLEPILGTESWFVKSVLAGVAPTAIRKEFSTAERSSIELALLILINNKPDTFYLTYDIDDDLWLINNSGTEPESWWIRITVNTDSSWNIYYDDKRLVAHSDEVKFWITNDRRQVITHDTLNTNLDSIVILQANVGTSGCALAQNYIMDVLAQELIDAGPDQGLESIHDLHIIPDDADNNGFPDDVTMSYLFGPNNFVYFNREDTSSPWVWMPSTQENIDSYNADTALPVASRKWKRENGKAGVNFLWMHRTPRYHLIDPSATNIIDQFIISRGYYSALKLWLNGRSDQRPEAPTSFQLRSDYNYLLDNKMISDTVILHPGKIKIIIGKHAADELKAKIKVIRSANRSLTNNQIKTIIVDAVNEFFDINNWEFGETFYFTELSAFIHSRLPVDIDSVVLVPSHSSHVFGDLFQVFAKEDEIIQPSISVNDIEIVQSLNPRILKQTL